MSFNRSGFAICNMAGKSWQGLEPVKVVTHSLQHLQKLLFILWQRSALFKKYGGIVLDSANLCKGVVGVVAAVVVAAAAAGVVVAVVVVVMKKRIHKKLRWTSVMQLRVSRSVMSESGRRVGFRSENPVIQGWNTGVASTV